MDGRNTDVNANVTSTRPFTAWGTIRKSGVKDIGRTSKDVVVLRTEDVISHGEGFERIGGLFSSGKVIVLMHSELKSEAPEVFIDDSRPSRHSMQQHDSGFSSDDANVAFSEAVLPMSADA